MSVTVTERVDSRRLTASREGIASSLEMYFNVQGTDNETVAKVAADQASPPTFGVGNPLFYKQTVSVEVIDPNLWLATVRYDTTGRTERSATGPQPRKH